MSVRSARTSAGGAATVPAQSFYITTTVGRFLVSGEHIEFPGLRDFRFFVHRQFNRPGFTVSEEISGMSIPANGPTKIAAIDASANEIYYRGSAVVRKRIRIEQRKARSLETR